MSHVQCLRWDGWASLSTRLSSKTSYHGGRFPRRSEQKLCGLAKPSLEEVRHFYSIPLVKASERASPGSRVGGEQIPALGVRS